MFVTLSRLECRLIHMFEKSYRQLLGCDVNLPSSPKVLGSGRLSDVPI